MPEHAQTLPPTREQIRSASSAGDGHPALGYRSPRWRARELGATDLRWKFVDAAGAALGVDRFGETSPAAEVCRRFGLAGDNLVAAA